MILELPGGGRLNVANAEDAEAILAAVDHMHDDSRPLPTTALDALRRAGLNAGNPIYRSVLRVERERQGNPRLL